MKITYKHLKVSKDLMKEKIGEKIIENYNLIKKLAVHHITKDMRLLGVLWVKRFLPQ